MSALGLSRLCTSVAVLQLYPQFQTIRGDFISHAWCTLSCYIPVVSTLESSVRNVHCEWLLNHLHLISPGGNDSLYPYHCFMERVRTPGVFESEHSNVVAGDEQSGKHMAVHDPSPQVSQLHWRLNLSLQGCNYVQSFGNLMLHGHDSFKLGVRC